MFDHLQNPEGNPFGPDQGAEGVAEPASSAGQQAERRAQWGLALKGATLYTAMAVKAKDWAKAHQGEDLMATASGRAGLDSALLAAIFGGEVPELDLSNRLLAACYEAGHTASDQAVAAAREVVRANKAAREEAAQNRRAAQRAVESAAYAAKKDERAVERQAAAAEAGLVIGAEVHVHWTYQQAKRGVATTAAGQTVECWGRLPGAGAGEGVATVKKIGGRLPVVELKD